MGDPIDLWYFETWSPQDGIAFASRRPAKAAADYEPAVTVSLTPPNWQPLRVSPATAWRAERESFQVEFLSAKDLPIGFATLDSLVEVVRQAYLGSSGGPGDEEGGDGPPRNNFPVPPQGPNSSEWDDALWTFAEEQGDVRDRALDIVRRLSSYLEAFFDHFAFVTLTLMLRDGRTNTRDLAQWVNALFRMACDYGKVATTLSNSSAHLTPFWPWTVSPYGVSGRIDLTFLVPNPLDVTPPYLGDFMCRKLATRGRIKHLKFEDFAALVFCAAAITTTASLPALLNTPSDGAWRRAIYVEAIVWLITHLPTVDTKTEAGQALDRHFKP